MVSSTTSTFPTAKPGCEDQDHCGDVSIPFPFGTREGCYLNDKFFINCSSSNYGSPFQPFLTHGNIIVKDISLEGQLRVLYDVGYDCYNPKNNAPSDYSSPSMSLAIPFVFNSTANKFTALGCDTIALVKSESKSRFYTTCISICDYKGDVENGYYSDNCCCQTSLPGGASQINVTLDSFYNHSFVSTFNPCSYGFVVEEKAFKFYADNLTNIDLTVPAVVDWAIANETCEEARKNLASFACKTENSDCYDPDGAFGYRCKCKDSFEGNPFLF